MNKEILIISIVFFDYEIVKKHIDFIVSIKDKADIVIIENKSEASDNIKNICLNLLASQDILKYYLFDENIWGHAILTFLYNNEIDLTKYKYILLTDGDLICKDSNWLQEQLDIINKNQNIFCCAMDLSIENLPIKTFPEAAGWIPPSTPTSDNFIECPTGVHSLLFNTEDFLGMIQYLKKENTKFDDVHMYHYCYGVLKKKWVKTKYAKAYHLTWDTYADLNHPYTIEKKRIYANQDLVNKWCGYTVFSLDTLTNTIKGEIIK